MANMIGRQVCFRLDKSLPDVPPSGPICLLDTQSEALSALLQVFACGEESASLGFAYLQNSHVDDMARAGLARIAREELTHERLLRSLRAALPVPPKDKELRHAIFRFYCGIAQADIGLHLASITALDSALCLILSTLLAPKGVLAKEPTVAAIFRRIHRDEAGHVRFSRRLAVEFSDRNSIGIVAERTRLGLIDILARRGAAFDHLDLDSDRLFARLRRVPHGLFP
jgi:hypothetical protein